MGCFSRGTALLALHPLLKTVAFSTGKWPRTRARPVCFRIPHCETGCDACSHKSAKWAENIELPYLWLRNDGGTEPDRGHSVSFSWPAYPSVWKVARTISARHALISEQVLGKKYATAHYRQAKLYSRNLINIATGTRFRQHGHPANRRNQPSKPALTHFFRECGVRWYSIAERRRRIARGVEEIGARIYTELSSILCAIKCFSRCRDKPHATHFLPE